jgi:cytochrome c-type biogenesis protein CcmH
VSAWCLTLALLMAPPSDKTAEDPAFLIGRELRCPVCQGMAIAESPATMAQDMMKRVREMLDEGKSSDEIKAYFVERYGEWVLLNPPTHGVSLWVWALPPAFVLVGLGVVARQLRRLRRQPAPVGATALAAPAAVPVAADDPYLQAIREEVQR